MARTSSTHAAKSARVSTSRGGALPLARTSDKHDLYQRAVQCVEAEIDFVDQTFTKLRSRKAKLLREDFCGTANTSCEWVRRRPDNIAVGIDLDPKPMEWGRGHTLAALNEEQRARVILRQENVLDAGKYSASGGRAQGYDALLAMNFSYWCLKDRATMLRYFTGVYKSLVTDGIFFMDFYGGADAFREMKERRKIRTPAAEVPAGAPARYTYVWDQERYDPISGELKCHIHFEFPDGSVMNRAFSYEWRLWTIPEIRDILTEAGFTRVTVYWEGDDGKGGGDGIFKASKHGEACPAFIAYIVAER